ncbi:MAG: DUF2877 domain-containing protein [Candidatus Ranarchaeia archaeon]
MFKTTVNFQSATPYLFSLRHPNSPRDSWSVILSEPVDFISLVTQGEQIIIQKDKIVFPQIQFLILDVPTWRSQSISTFPAPSSLQRSTIEGYWKKIPSIQNPLHMEVIRRTKSVLKTLVELDLQDFTTNICSLIGFGNGTTPAGDDIISGVWLSIHWGITAKLITLTWHQALHKLVFRTPRVTTDISHDLLLKSSFGYTNEYLEQFILALSQPKYTQKRDDYFNHTLALGHSSGADLLVGFLAGIYALVWKQNLMDH